MPTEKTSKEQEQMEMLKSLLEKPCAVCNQRPVTVKRFVPVDPAAFGAGTGEAIYFPVCRRCIDEGIDYPFFKSTLAHCGVKLGVKPDVELDVKPDVELDVNIDDSDIS